MCKIQCIVCIVAIYCFIVIDYIQLVVELSVTFTVQGYYDTMDAGYRDQFGNICVMARSDDVINVAGHRLSTGQLEEVLHSC